MRSLTHVIGTPLTVVGDGPSVIPLAGIVDAMRAKSAERVHVATHQGAGLDTRDGACGAQLRRVKASEALARLVRSAVAFDALGVRSALAPALKQG